MIATTAARTPEAPRLPPELLGSVPRDVRLTASGMAVAVAAIAITVGALVAAIAMSIAYAQADAERQLREREGVAAQAEVVKVDLSRGEHPRQVVTYRYDVDGRSYSGRTALRENDRRGLEPFAQPRSARLQPSEPRSPEGSRYTDVQNALTRGTAIRIEYLTSQPETSWVDGYGTSGVPLWAIPLTVVSLLMTAAAITWNLRRQWILLSEGRVAQARVTGLKKVNSDKRRTYRVSYEFRTLSGATQTSRCDIGKAPPAIGGLVPVVYHRDQPQWSAVYPLQLVRPGRLVQ